MTNKSFIKFTVFAASLVFIALLSVGAFAQCGARELHLPAGAADMEIKGEVTESRNRCIYSFNGRLNETLTLKAQYGSVVFNVLYPDGSSAARLPASEAGAGGRTDLTLLLDRTSAYFIVVTPRKGYKFQKDERLGFQMRFGIKEAPNVVVP